VAFIGIYVVIIYLWPEVMSQEVRMGFLSDIVNEGKTARFHHPAYHLAMLSFFITVLQLIEFWRYTIYEKGFILLNTFVQAYSILIANYRATIMATIFFLLCSVLIVIFLRERQKFFKRAFLIAALLGGLILLFSDVILSLPWLARIIDTRSILNDPNMVYRIIELVLGVSQMTTMKDYMLGMGYGHPFLYNGALTPFLHNGFVSIYYNFGIVGVILLLNIWVSFFLFIRRYLRRTSPMAYYIAATYFVALMIQNWSSGIFNREEPAIISFVLFLLVVVLHSRQSHDDVQDSIIRV